MLKRNRNRKLHLTAQTIRTLDTTSLAQPAGGADDSEPSANPRQRTCHGTVCLSILPE